MSSSIARGRPRADSRAGTFPPRRPAAARGLEAGDTDFLTIVGKLSRPYHRVSPAANFRDVTGYFSRQFPVRQFQIHDQTANVDVSMADNVANGCQRIGRRNAHVRDQPLELLEVAAADVGAAFSQMLEVLALGDPFIDLGRVYSGYTQTTVKQGLGSAARCTS